MFWLSYPPPPPAIGPPQQAVFSSLAEEFGGSTKVVRGDELLKEGDCYPMVRVKKEGIGCSFRESSSISPAPR